MATVKHNTKLVTPPIDERETFVSLSKNLTDSDVSMEVKLKSLYKIQQTDSKIDSIYLLRGELPKEVEDLKDDIEGLNMRLTNISAEIAKIDKLIADDKIRIDTFKDSIVKQEERRNNVANSREYDSLTKSIENDGLDILRAEKFIKDNKVALAEKKEALAAAKELLKGREIDLVNKEKELVDIVAETAKEEEALLAEKAELSKFVEERMLAAYDRVRSNARNHLAVVTVKRNACGGCFNNIPPQRQLDIALNKKIIVCEYCGRILVSTEFEE